MARKIFALGDSITFGAWDPAGGWVARLKARAHARWCETGDDDDRVLFHGLGVPGDTSRDVLARARVEVYARSQRDPMPTLAVVFVGTNDLKRPEGGGAQISLDAYRENLEEIARHLRAPFDAAATGSPPLIDQVIFAGLPAVGAKANARKDDDVARYQAAMAEVADRVGAEHVPLHHALGPADLGDDDLHPNASGHAKLADLVGRALNLS